MTPDALDLDPIPWVTFDRRRPLKTLHTVTAKTWFGAREQGADKWRCDMGHIWAIVVTEGQEPEVLVRREMTRRRDKAEAAEAALLTGDEQVKRKTRRAA